MALMGLAQTVALEAEVLRRYQKVTEPDGSTAIEINVRPCDVCLAKVRGEYQKVRKVNVSIEVRVA